MSEPSASPSTVENEVGPQCPPLFSRPTPRAPRPTLGGILPLTKGRFAKEQTGPDLDERPHSFSIKRVRGSGFVLGFLPGVKNQKQSLTPRRSVASATLFGVSAAC